jgi:hypothetical protein
MENEEQTTGTQEAENTNAEGGETSENENEDQTQNNSGSEKTFTQKDMSATAAREKSQGKKSILKLFGVKDEESAKSEAEEFKKWRAKNQTAEQKLNEQTETVKDAESRAKAAENKLSCVMAGVNKESIDDALAIATLKVTDDKDLDAVLEEMKNEAKYKGFFDDSEEEEDSSKKGTGRTPGNVDKTKDNANDSIAKRLALNVTKNKETKSSYFKHS